MHAFFSADFTHFNVLVVSLLEHLHSLSHSKRLHMGGTLAIQVGDEVGEQTRFLVALHIHVDAVVSDELVQCLGSLLDIRIGHFGISAHNLLDTTIGAVAHIVQLVQRVCEFALLADLELFLFHQEGSLVLCNQGDELRLATQGGVVLDAFHHTLVEGVMRTFWHVLQIKILNLFHKHYTF